MTSYSADVVENSFIGTFVTKVSAVDDDDGDNGLIQYIIGNAAYNSELDRKTSNTADDRRSPEKSRRQKDGSQRYGGERRKRGRRQRNNIATRMSE